MTIIIHKIQKIEFCFEGRNYPFVRKASVIKKAVTNDTKSVTTWCRRWDLTASLRFAVNGNDLCSPFGEGVQVPSFFFLQTNKKRTSNRNCLLFLVQKMGLEPTRTHIHRLLRPERLPIPPLLQIYSKRLSTPEYNIIFTSYCQ